MYIYICIYICIYVYICVYTHTYICIHMCVCICIYIYGYSRFSIHEVTAWKFKGGRLGIPCGLLKDVWQYGQLLPNSPRHPAPGRSTLLCRHASTVANPPPHPAMVGGLVLSPPVPGRIRPWNLLEAPGGPWRPLEPPGTAPHEAE